MNYTDFNKKEVNVINIDECLFVLYLKYRNDIIISECVKKIKKALFPFKYNDIVNFKMLKNFNDAMSFFSKTHVLEYFNYDYEILLNYLNPYNTIISEFEDGSKNILKNKTFESLYKIFDINVSQISYTNNETNVYTKRKIDDLIKLIKDNILEEINKLEAEIKLINNNVNAITTHDLEKKIANLTKLYNNMYDYLELTRNLDKDYKEEYDQKIKDVTDRYKKFQEYITDREAEIYLTNSSLIHDIDKFKKQLETKETNLNEEFNSFKGNMVIMEKDLIGDDDRIKKKISDKIKEIQDITVSDLANNIDLNKIVVSPQFKEYLKTIIPTQISNFFKNLYNDEEFKRIVIDGIESFINSNNFEGILNPIINKTIQKELKNNEMLNNILSNIDENKNNIGENLSKINTNNETINNKFKEFKDDYDISKVNIQKNSSDIKELNSLIQEYENSAYQKNKIDKIINFLNLDPNTLNNNLFSDVKDLYDKIMENTKIITSDIKDIKDKYDIFEKSLPSNILKTIKNMFDTTLNEIIIKKGIEIDIDTLKDKPIKEKIELLIDIMSKINKNDIKKLNESLNVEKGETLASIQAIKEEIEQLRNTKDQNIWEKLSKLQDDIEEDIPEKFKRIDTKLSELRDQYIKLEQNIKENLNPDDFKKIKDDTDLLNFKVNKMLPEIKENLVALNSFIYRQFSEGNIPNYIKETANTLKGYGESIAQISYAMKLISRMLEDDTIPEIKIPIYNESPISYSNNAVVKDVKKILEFNSNLEKSDQASGFAGSNCQILDEVYSKFISKYYLSDDKNYFDKNKLKLSYDVIITNYTYENIDNIIYKLYCCKFEYDIKILTLFYVSIKKINFKKENFLLNYLKRIIKEILLIYNFKEITKNKNLSNKICNSLYMKYLEKLIINDIKLKVIEYYLITFFKLKKELIFEIGYSIVIDFLTTSYFLKIKNYIKIDKPISYLFIKNVPENDILNIDELYSINFLNLSIYFRNYYLYMLNFKQILFKLYTVMLKNNIDENANKILNYLCKNHILINEYFKSRNIEK